MSHRLFVAIRPPPHVLDLLIDTMEGLDEARWQSEEQLHLTLRFIGEVDTPEANDLADALGRGRMSSFSLRLSGIGHFERKGRVHSLWAGLAPSPELLELQRKIEQACRAAGLDAETRRFTPHITLARMSCRPGAVAPFLTQHARLTSPCFAADSFTLYESTLSRHGSVYRPVLRYPLG